MEAKKARRRDVLRARIVEELRRDKTLLAMYANLIAEFLVPRIRSKDGVLPAEFYDSLEEDVHEALKEVIEREGAHLYTRFGKFMKEREGGRSPDVASRGVGDQAFAAIIEELRSNWRVEQPTKLEQMLEILRSRPEGVTIDDLSPLYREAADPEDAARKAITKLNVKLERFGLRLGRPHTFRVLHLGPSAEKS